MKNILIITLHKNFSNSRSSWIFLILQILQQQFLIFAAKLKTTGIDVEKSLNLMAKQRTFLGEVSYKNFMKKFYEEHNSFFPQNHELKDLLKKFGEKVAKIGDGSFYKITRLIEENIKPQIIEEPTQPEVQPKNHPEQKKFLKKLLSIFRKKHV